MNYDRDHNIIQMHNNVLWDWEYFVQYSSHSAWMKEYFVEYCLSHKTLLWIWILLCSKCEILFLQFIKFCTQAGITWHLTPNQNGVAEHKHQIIINPQADNSSKWIQRARSIFLQRRRWCTHDCTCNLDYVSNNLQLSTIEEWLKSFRREATDRSQKES